MVQNYVRNLIDFENSAALNLHNFDRIEELLAKGDNVVVLANHQTEADPGRRSQLVIGRGPRVQHREFWCAG